MKKVNAFVTTSNCGELLMKVKFIIPVGEDVNLEVLRYNLECGARMGLVRETINNMVENKIKVSEDTAEKILKNMKVEVEICDTGETAKEGDPMKAELIEGNLFIYKQALKRIKENYKDSADEIESRGEDFLSVRKNGKTVEFN